MSLAGGQFIGQYRVLRNLVAGQNSLVWEAMDPSGNRRAIKTLLADKHGDREQIAFMKQEFSVGKDLSHPNIIRMYELLDYKGSPALVMELFDGPNLKTTLITKGASALAPTLEKIITQAAEALSYFHKQGWIHRDIKPENFLTDDQANLRMIDLALGEKKKTGFAKWFAGKSKKIQGTRSYMSPEQIRGLTLDFQADIYSMGCMFFQLGSGILPFTASNPNEVLQRHLTAPIPSLIAQESNITPEFSALVAKMMAKKPEQRPESMAHVVSELKKISVFKVPPK